MLSDAELHDITRERARALAERRLARLRADLPFSREALLMALELAGKERRELARRADELDRRQRLLSTGPAGRVHSLWRAGWRTRCDLYELDAHVSALLDTIEELDGA